MKVLDIPKNDVAFDAIARGRMVARVIADGRGLKYFCLDGPASGAYPTRENLMQALRRHYGDTVRLCVAQRRPPRRPTVAAGGMGPPRPAAKPHPPIVKPPPSGPPRVAPRPRPPTPPSEPSKARPPEAWGAVRWVFGSKPQQPKSEDHPLLEILKYRVAPDVDFATLVQSGKRFGLTDVPAIGADARSGGRIKPVPRPRPTTRPGGRGTGRRLPRK